MEKSLKFKPVFVIGAQRSGTTFLAERLGRFENFMTTPEAQIIKKILSWSNKNFDLNQAEIHANLVYDEFRFWTLGIHFTKKQIIESLFSGGGIALANELLSTYCSEIQKPTAIYWVEHSPENIHDVPWLSTELPEAKFIHIIRDARGVLNSFRGIKWGPHSARRIADYWTSTTLAGAILESSLPTRVISVRYEDILANTRSELERLVQFVGAMPTSESSNISFKLPDFTLDQHSLVGEAIDVRRATAWREMLSDRDIKTIEHYARMALIHFGYIKNKAPQNFKYSGKDAAIDYVLDGWKLLRAKIKQPIDQKKYVRKMQKPKTNGETI